MTDSPTSKQKLTHERACPALARPLEDDCTCGLQWRIQLQTEQTLHAAWRKRAEEAEAELAILRTAHEPSESLCSKCDGKGWIPACDGPAGFEEPCEHCECPELHEERASQPPNERLAALELELATIKKYARQCDLDAAANELIEIEDRASATKTGDRNG